MILAVINNKGGTGKTTTAVSVAASLARDHGRRVLLADLDSQASASLSMGIPRTELNPSIADAILEGRPLSRFLRQTEVPGLSVATGSPALANADLIMADMAGRESCLERALAPLKPELDDIIIDCPPSLSMLSINAMVAADEYILPTQPEYLALEGLVGMLEAVELIRKKLDASCRLLGIVLTRVDYRRKVTEEIISMIREHYKGDVLKTEIRIDVKLVEAPSFGKDIFAYARSSTGAEGYAALTEEILKKGKRA